MRTRFSVSVSEYVHASLPPMNFAGVPHRISNASSSSRSRANIEKTTSVQSSEDGNEAERSFSGVDILVIVDGGE